MLQSMSTSQPLVSSSSGCSTVPGTSGRCALDTGAEDVRAKPSLCEGEESARFNAACSGPDNSLVGGPEARRRLRSSVGSEVVRKMFSLLPPLVCDRRFDFEPWCCKAGGCCQASSCRCWRPRSLSRGVASFKCVSS